jgi:septal ring factor EnvC (AmiA/AmiB activator)
MVEAMVIACMLLAFVCVISKGYTGRRLEEQRHEVNEAQHEVQQTAGELRQLQGALARDEERELRLKAEYQGLADELAEIRNRLARRAGGSPAG